MDLEDTSDWSKTKVEKSLTEQSALDDFLTTAEMAGKEFESGRCFIHHSYKIYILKLIII